MSTRPNILLILTDQHAPKVAGFAGDPDVRTQNLDALARQSVRFQQAICPSPCCTPSRMCILTGKDVEHCAAWANHWTIFPEHLTWPQHFADHGYTTCLVGKMHFGGRDQIQGFTHRPYGDLRHGLGHQPEPLSMFPGYHHVESAGVTEIPESLLQDVVVTRETLAFLREHRDQNPDEPWFVCAGYSRPHSPLTAPGRYIRCYRDRLPQVEEPQPDRLEPYARRLYDQIAGALNAQQRQRGLEAYYACVDFVDDCIGELLEGLEKSGLLDNTIVIYTSDHGEMAGVHGLWQKGVYYEPSVGVPLLMRGPGIAPGHRDVNRVISLIDLYPTTCALCGLPVPEGLDGVDFSGVLRDPASADAPRAYAISQMFAQGTLVQSMLVPTDAPYRAWRAIRTEHWKYIEVQGGEPLLFDLQNDPGESRNLAGHPGHATRCRELRALLFEGFSWERAMRQLEADRQRIAEYRSGLKPTVPNQYKLADGRTFDAEAALYGARWLIEPDATGGIIPQQFG